MENTLDKKYNKTIYAGFVGYVVQAIVNNFVPLLFLTFQDTYGITFNKISMLITINFAVQLVVDLLSAKFIDKIGYRISIIIAHVASALGLIGLAFLPDIMPTPFVGLVISVGVYAVGGGIIEVLVSPIVESCPTRNKEGTMSLLHSFYSWGYVAVVLISTLFFGIFGIENWKFLSCLWAVVPIVNALVFVKTPMVTVEAEEEKSMGISQLLKNKIFIILFVMMLCAGACEQGISQWVSAFAEKALGVSKTVGDLAGPLLFATLMGISRLGYAKFSEKINMENAMFFSSILCVASYALASLAPNSLLSFVGCAFCGLSVGIMWPGTFSLGTGKIKGGGTAMFALFALAGDVGCSTGPTLVGFVSESFGGDMKKGIFCGMIFPLVMVIALLFLKKETKKNKNNI